MIPFLAPFFPGDWRVHGETLRLAPTGGLSVRILLSEPVSLRAVLEDYREARWPDADPRAVASAWTLHYLWALLAPVVAAIGGAGLAVPCAAADMRLLLDSAHAPQAFCVSEAGARAAPANPWRRYEELVWDHLAPLAEAMWQAARLPRKVVWAGALRYLDVLFDALRTVAGLPVPERELLFGAPRWAYSERANPLCLPPRRPPAGGCGPVYPECCLYYLLPGQGQCAACPLPAQEAVQA